MDAGEGVGYGWGAGRTAGGAREARSIRVAVVVGLVVVAAPSTWL